MNQQRYWNAKIFATKKIYKNYPGSPYQIIWSNQCAFIKYNQIKWTIDHSENFFPFSCSFSFLFFRCHHIDKSNNILIPSIHFFFFFVFVWIILISVIFFCHYISYICTQHTIHVWRTHTLKCRHSFNHWFKILSSSSSLLLPEYILFSIPHPVNGI